MMKIVCTQRLVAISFIFWLAWGVPFRANGDFIRPNIVLIQADDLGFDDLHIHGNPYVETPCLDKLGNEGIQFGQFYVNPVCAPSRASLLTGRHFLKTGVSHVHGGKDYLHLSEVTIANRLKQAGYATAIWGKWHSGKTNGYFPWQRGFDEAYMADLYRHKESSGLFNGIRVRHCGWADEVIVDYAIDFIGRQKGKPFFAYLSSMSCHEPLQAPNHLHQKYLNKGLGSGLAALYGMVEMLDTQIGRLLNFLEEKGLRQNTIVLFLSDNGPAINIGELSEAERALRRIHDFKGYKGNIWENGVKSPLFISWPGYIRPGISSELADVTDVFPTLVNLAGGTLAGLEIDGRDISPLLLGEKLSGSKLSFNYADKGWPPNDLPWTPEGTLDEYRPVDPSMLSAEEQVISVRNARYKLLLNPAANMNKFFENQKVALYDILLDPYEERNLVGHGLDAEVQLRDSLVEWFDNQIKSSPHAFSMPLFKIAGDSSMIYAVGATRLEGQVIPTFNWLANWTAKGDQATYALEVVSPGKFMVSLSHSPAIAVPFEISLDDRVYGIVLNGENTEIELGYLASGKHSLVLRKPIAEGVINRIKSIHMIKTFPNRENPAREWILKKNDLVLKTEPSIGGRISSLQYRGVELLATYRDQQHFQWGSTVWPAPQEDWRWPPPPGMDRDTYQVTQFTPELIKMESKANAYRTIKVFKQFELLDPRTVRIRYEFINEGDASIKVGIWENTRVECHGQVSWAASSSEPQVSKDLPGQDSVSILNLDGQQGKKKLFLESAGGWLTYQKGNVSFTKKFPVVPAEQVAPGHAAIEIYFDTEKGFAELENHSDYVELAPGQSKSVEIFWILKDEGE